MLCIGKGWILFFMVCFGKAELVLTPNEERTFIFSAYHSTSTCSSNSGPSLENITIRLEDLLTPSLFWDWSAGGQGWEVALDRLGKWTGENLRNFNKPKTLQLEWNKSMEQCEVGANCSVTTLQKKWREPTHSSSLSWAISEPCGKGSLSTLGCIGSDGASMSVGVILPHHWHLWVNIWSSICLPKKKVRRGVLWGSR